MKLKNHTIITLLLLSVWVGCISPPEDFPTVPQIDFNNLEFVQTSGSDSLIITLDFRDAEGDLGLNATDIYPPFNELTYITDDAGQFITYSERPEDAPDFNNRDWVIFPLINNQEIKDTLWVAENEDYYNILVKFFIKRGGNYTEFNWSDPPYFTTFNGRFPRMLEEEQQRAIEGEIRYSMLSLGWNSVFRNDTLKLEIKVKDRALNESNVVSTPDFTLSQIER
ncbi:hypothetical protein Q4534_13290 [Cyclobacterium sp. 1_MG-2023]|uniref:hypothetical protein n=1 Tax=Cyclobacterium sp. 1_MG-2023 TaxID=3062681 RepID=UPI0026E40B34|nr:hypothetical protein [Cyclobacterium sp. 1_MG-2023]MDO6438389.1 hypothetical protein [Cyclobacterium sp. 1_MG-2023]